MLIHLFNSSILNPVFATAPFVQHDGTTSLHEWGVTARMARFVRPRAQSDEPYLLTLARITRIRLTNTSTNNSLSTDYIVTGTATSEASSHPLPRSARKRESWARIAHVIDETEPDKAAALADAIVSAVGAEHVDKLALLFIESPSLRLQHVLTKQLSAAEVSTKIATALTAINAELQRLRVDAPNAYLQGSRNIAEDEDDLDVLVRRDALPAGTEIRRVASTEARRLRRIPPQNVEHGVVRNYLEWLTALPRTPPPPSSDTLTGSDFLPNAKSQLDADHFNLDKVKRRLTEYLAVVRLRALIAQEAEMEQVKAQEVVLKDAIKDHKDKDKASEAFVRAGETSSPSPTSMEIQGRRVTKPSKPQYCCACLFRPLLRDDVIMDVKIAVNRALGRPFQRIALGGVRDEADIRDHRRRYVASEPGLLAQALRKAGRMDPIILLDEIDKVGQSYYHGDPAAALLEVRDPEQNVAFNDHYINVPIDLLQVLFICTANTLDTIAPPLLDRCEVIQLSGYTHDEKFHITRRFLLPKQLAQNGLSEAHVQVTEPALLSIITQCTREAGVRTLGREIGGVVRFKAVEWAAHVDARGLSPSSGASPVSSLPSSPTVADTDAGGGLDKSARLSDAEYDPVVEADELEKILGLSRHDREDRDREARRGVVRGLVVTGMGEGELMPIESIATPGNGNLKLTGSLGDSAKLALSWVKTHAYDLGITTKRTQDPLRIPDAMIVVHVHLPAGAQKKDGPSVGVAIVCAIVSLLTGKCVPPTIAMSGEITLRGRVSPVGGIKEKVLDAHRAGANR
ncbi:ATP-dependent protease La [Russula emetica]|nr:ATP-dependent protease La [Russula emetica]